MIRARLKHNICHWRTSIEPTRCTYLTVSSFQRRWKTESEKNHSNTMKHEKKNLLQASADKWSSGQIPIFHRQLRRANTIDVNVYLLLLLENCFRHVKYQKTVFCLLLSVLWLGSYCKVFKFINLSNFFQPVAHIRNQDRCNKKTLPTRNDHIQYLWDLCLRGKWRSRKQNKHSA